jgi:hypothetical protein
MLPPRRRQRREQECQPEFHLQFGDSVHRLEARANSRHAARHARLGLRRHVVCLVWRRRPRRRAAAARSLLAKEGYDPQFGARPLKRAIQEHLLDPLATRLLAGEFARGDRIKVGAGGNGLVFKAEERVG